METGGEDAASPTSYSIPFFSETVERPMPPSMTLMPGLKHVFDLEPPSMLVPERQPPHSQVDSIVFEAVDGAPASFELWTERLANAKSQSPLYASSRLRVKNSQTNKSGTYGELFPELVKQILGICRASPLDYVLDIGSGVGQVALQASCTTLCSSFGLEIRADLMEVAQELCPLAVGSGGVGEKTGMGRVELVRGDAREPDDRFINAVRMATIVFINNVVFDEELNQSIVGLLGLKKPRFFKVFFSSHFSLQLESCAKVFVFRCVFVVLFVHPIKQGQESFAFQTFSLGSESTLRMRCCRAFIIHHSVSPVHLTAFRGNYSCFCWWCSVHSPSSQKRTASPLQYFVFAIVPPFPADGGSAATWLKLCKVCFECCLFLSL